MYPNNNNYADSDDKPIEVSVRIINLDFTQWLAIFLRAIPAFIGALILLVLIPPGLVVYLIWQGSDLAAIFFTKLGEWTGLLKWKTKPKK